LLFYFSYFLVFQLLVSQVSVIFLLKSPEPF